MRSQYHGLVLLFGIMLILGGCPFGNDDDTTGDDDTGDDDDNQADDDTAADGTWMDPGTGLIWQVDWELPYVDWQTAMDSCEDLTLGGSSDWRLPSIDELRSLIRGCPALETGGSCGVHGGCLTLSCWNDDDCYHGCPLSGGSEGPGLYHPVELGVWGFVWSSSTVDDVEAEAWLLIFEAADLWNVTKTETNDYHCVR